MKIGILTLPLHHNYGGVLQAYALVMVLRKFGFDPILLNRRVNNGNCVRIILRNILSYIKRLYKSYILRDKSYILCNPFVLEYPYGPLYRFITQKIPRCNRIISSKTLSQYICNHKLDVVIVGSDQVWRQEYSPCITDFFLSIEPKHDFRKIAYAASFGTEECDIDSDKRQACISGLKNFDAISVRELSGLKILRNTFGFEGKLVLDPTLLLSAYDYESLFEGFSKSTNSSGLVSYILDDSEDKLFIWRDVKSQYNIEAHVNLKCFSFRKPQGDYVIPTLEEWLLAFHNADYVVTDSFHGCVFSIIFKKQFVVIANPNRGLDRFYSLLDNLNLRNRLVFDYAEFKKRNDELLETIDYKKVDIRRHALMVDSLKYLQESLMSAKKN